MDTPADPVSVLVFRIFQSRQDPIRNRFHQTVSEQGDRLPSGHHVGAFGNRSLDRMVGDGEEMDQGPSRRALKGSVRVQSSGPDLGDGAGPANGGSGVAFGA